MNNIEPTLSYLSNEERLKAYNTIVSGAAHIWSKGQMQKDRLSEVLSIFIQLAEHDPYFLAHFTSYAIKKLDSKDLKVVATFANSLSDADGTPFITGKDDQGRPIYSPTYKKPNLRMISQAAVQELDPKLVSRVIAIANIKQSLGTRRAATHFANSLKTAIRKWIRFREQNPKALEGIKKAAFAPTVKSIYRMMHMKPSQEAAEIFGWKQGSIKKGNVEKIEKRNLIDFKDLTDIQIAQKIRDDKLPVLGVMGALPGKISPVVAAAVLEQASGNQAVILRNLFDSQGLLKDKEVMKVFTEKIQTAKTALDRVEKLNTEVDIEVQKVLKTAKADKRKKDVGNIGRVYVHIDISGSMTGAIEFAKNNGAIIAECISDPSENFFWGAFNTTGYSLSKPASFEKDAFMASLYGLSAGGGTDCIACYADARNKNCDIDIYITDQGHTCASIEQRILAYDRQGLSRPKATVIVDFSNGSADHAFKDVLEKLGIPVSVIKPHALTESALVSQAVKTALLGATAVIDEIMNTPLLKLPTYWESV